MNNHRIIELQPGESVTIKTADSVKEWLTISEFAKLNKMSRNTVYSHIEKGKISAIKENGKTKINYNQLNF